MIAGGFDGNGRPRLDGILLSGLNRAIVRSKS